MYVWMGINVKINYFSNPYPTMVQYVLVGVQSYDMFVLEVESMCLFMVGATGIQS